MLCRAQPHFSNRMIPESPKRKKVRPLNINGRMVRLKFKKTAAVLAQGISLLSPVIVSSSCAKTDNFVFGGLGRKTKLRSF